MSIECKSCERYKNWLMRKLRDESDLLESLSTLAYENSQFERELSEVKEELDLRREEGLKLRAQLTDAQEKAVLLDSLYEMSGLEYGEWVISCPDPSTIDPIKDRERFYRAIVANTPDKAPK